MSAEASPEQSQTPDEVAAGVNAQITYTNWAVFRLDLPLPDGEDETQELIDDTEAELDDFDAVTLRGFYDVAGFRADADLMVWWHSPDIDQLQRAYHSLCASPLGQLLAPVWSVIGVTRPAEFNRSHVPNFMVDPNPRRFLCVYPFVRSYDWYVLPPEERSGMLREHGLAARDFADVRANTVEGFALGDYEFLLAFEADELHRIVDLMRTLRATQARLHVREEIPFFTGPLVTLSEWAARVSG